MTIKFEEILILFSNTISKRSQVTTLFTFWKNELVNNQSLINPDKTCRLYPKTHKYPELLILPMPERMMYLIASP